MLSTPLRTPAHPVPTAHCPLPTAGATPVRGLAWTPDGSGSLPPPSPSSASGSSRRSRPASSTSAAAVAAASPAGGPPRPTLHTCYGPAGVSVPSVMPAPLVAALMAPPNAVDSAKWMERRRSMEASGVQHKSLQMLKQGVRRGATRSAHLCVCVCIGRRCLRAWRDG